MRSPVRSPVRQSFQLRSPEIKRRIEAHKKSEAEFYQQTKKYRQEPLRAESNKLVQPLAGSNEEESIAKDYHFQEIEIAQDSQDSPYVSDEELLVCDNNNMEQKCKDILVASPDELCYTPTNNQELARENGGFTL